MSFTLPRRTALPWKAQYRIIPSHYPLVDLFERLDLTERQKRALFAVQRRVNPRLRQALGTLQRVRSGDVVSGVNASVVMAAFTHSGHPSRFSDGAYGIYYAARTLETAIRETAWHREREARLASLESQAFHQRVFVGTIQQSLYDVRRAEFASLHHPDDYATPQAFARQLRTSDPSAWGVAYHSVRHQGGHCIAAFRPPAVSLPSQGAHLVYDWDGSRITAVFEQSAPLLTF